MRKLTFDVREINSIDDLWARRQKIGELTDSMDLIYSQLRSHPTSQRFYRQLFETSISSLPYLSDSVTEGLLKRNVSGNLSYRYDLSYSEGLFFNQLAVSSRINNPQKESILFTEYRFFRKTPYTVLKVMLDEKTGNLRKTDIFGHFI